MPYQVLARAYRPRSFSTLVGQTHVVQPLKNALLAGRLHHAYLFCGTRGTGKTTVARIFAKALNCLDLQAGEPCNRCDNCREIDTGSAVDVIEIDAASRTKVEDTRDFLDNVPYRPAKSQYKIYLIDEVHMLSTHSFNALLKTLEEPPEHVKFLLCTTDPQKCPMTVLSRCLQFYLRPLSLLEITQHLQHILQKESCSFDTEALPYIADAARGSMRDALSLLDQAINFGAGSVKKEQVLDMLGAVDPEEVFQLLACVLEHNTEGAFAFLNQFATKSDAYEHLCAALIQALHELAMSQARPAYVKECSPKRQSWIKQLAPKCKAHELQLLYQFALMGQKDIRQTPWPKQGFEMLLLRMLSFIPLPSVEAMTIKPVGIAASTPALHSAPALKGRVSTAAAHAPQSASAPTSFNAQVAPSARVPSTANSQAPSTVSTHALSNSDSQALLTSSAHMPSMPTPHVPRLDRGIHTPQPESLPPAPAENSPSSKVTALYNKLSHLTQENRAYVLRELVETLAFSGIARQVLLHSELLAFESGTIKLSLSKQYQASLSDHIKTHIEQTLKKAFSTSCSLEIHTAAGEVQSPIKKEALARQEQQTKAELAAAQNEHIQFLQQTFGAAIVPGSVKQVIS